MSTAAIAHQWLGAGAPVVLLNGGMMTMVAWDPIALPLAADYRVLRCDFRGQLMSPGTPPTSIEAHVEDVLRLLDEEQVDRAHLIGTSFGGLVGVVMAADHPARVASLVVGNATEHVSSQEWAATVPFVEACRAAANRAGDGGIVVDMLFPQTFSERYLETNRLVVAQRRALVAAMPPAYFEGLGAIVSLLNGLDLRPRLATIQCRTLVLAAEHDRTFPLPHSRALAAGIPGARIHVLDGAAHGVFGEEPQRVLAIVQAFLRG